MGTDYHAEGVKLLAYVRVPPVFAILSHLACHSPRPRAPTRNADADLPPPPPSSPFLSLQDQPGPGSFYEDVSPIFKLPNGGTFYIGNIRAAASAPTLEAHGITHIINAQDVNTENFHERDPRYTYLRFPIAHWWSAGDMNSNHGVRKFYEPLFGFVEKALKEGKNVMVHCLAGAHRAGTSGISMVMYLMKLSAPQAVMFVKERRPIVDPIGSFPDLLGKLERALNEPR